MRVPEARCLSSWGYSNTTCICAPQISGLANSGCRMTASNLSVGYQSDSLLDLRMRTSCVVAILCNPIGFLPGLDHDSLQTCMQVPLWC